MHLVLTERHCFYPDAQLYSTPSDFGLYYEDLALPGPEGRRLTGWRIPPAPNAPKRNVTVLHLHGNAQNMSAHLYGSYFLALEGFRLITLDYRGYGASPGEPSLAGIIEDGDAAVRFLLENPYGPDEPLVIFGQSMGAFTTAHLLPRFPALKAAVLEAGLVSFRDLFLEAYPGAEVRVPDGFSTLEPLGRSAVPKLFIHGTADTVVPLSHSQRLHQAAAGPKELMVLPG
ncbi:MAG: alpha/beta fold hydrolase, partial [Thermodesulfobacteriota bacterium]